MKELKIYCFDIFNGRGLVVELVVAKSKEEAQQFLKEKIQGEYMYLLAEYSIKEGIISNGEINYIE